jgi:hypothetical protein
MTQRDTQGPGGNWFMAKNLKRKISRQTPFKQSLVTTVIDLEI